MMARNSPVVALRKELKRLNIPHEFSKTGSDHWKLKFRTNGKTKTMFCSDTPSDGNAWRQATRELKRKLAE